MNEQLIAYIRQQLAANVSREAITSALVAEGHKHSEVDEAFASFESTAPVTSETTPATLSVAGVVSDPTSSAATASAGAVSTASPAPQQVDNKLPGVFKLLSAGFSIYKERFGVLVSIAATQALLVGLLGSAALLIFVFSRIVQATPFSITDPVGIVGIGMFILIVSVVIFVDGVWMWFFTVLASMQAIRGHAQKVSFKTAFTSARSLVAPFILVSALVAFVFLGMLAILGILSWGILSVVAVFLFFSGWMAELFMFIVAILLMLLFATRFVFVPWILISGERGMGALLASHEIVRGRFVSILWRGLGVSFIIGGTVWITHFLFSFAGSVVGDVLQTGLIVFVFIPILLTSIFYLYEQVQATLFVATVSSRARLRNIYVQYVNLGVITTIVALVVAVWWSFPMSSAHKISSSTPVASMTQAATPNTQSLKTYTNTKYGFSFQYPADLSVSPTKDASPGNKNTKIFRVYDAHYFPPAGAVGQDVRSQLREVQFRIPLFKRAF